MNYDLYSILESIAWLYRALGGYPFTLRRLVGSRKYILSTTTVTFNLIFFVIIVKYFSDYVALLKTTYDLNEDSLLIFILFVRHFASMLCVLDSMIMKIIHSKMILNSINELALQDVKLKKFGYCFNYKAAIKIFPLSIITFLVYTYALVNTDFFVFTEPPIPLLHKIFGNLSILVQIANATLFSLLIVNVGLRFKALNVSIEKVMNYSGKTLQLNEKTPVEFMRISAKLHAKLCEIAKAFNSTFVITILASIVKAFILSTAMLYYIFICFKDGLINVDFLKVTVFFMVLILNICIVIIVVLSCSWTSNQAATTIKVVRKILLFKVIHANDKSLNKMVHIFSMQICHHDLAFTAAGLFPLDPTLLQALAGAVTTYLVILIQFDPKVV